MNLPLPELQQLFHYNPISGAITYLCDRGPRKAGDLAGSTQSGLPCIYAAGRQWKAARVAWALAHGADPSPQHVCCRDGNPHNLALANLALSESAPRYSSPRRRPGRRPGWHKRDIRLIKKTGLFLATYNGVALGEFYTRKEALAARRLAAREDAESAENQDG